MSGPIPAIAGIARSGGSRAGYPVLLGAKVPLYALSGLARSGATRSNYTSTRPFISVGGIERGWRTQPLGAGVLAESLMKSDQMTGTPDTLTFTAYGWVPIEGDDVVVTLGSVNNLRRMFGGTVLSTVHRYVGGKPIARNMVFDASCIDYTWALNRYKVSGSYTNASVAAVAASLMTWAPSYTLRVDPDIGAQILDQITFTEQALSDALTQLVKRVGGEYLCDYLKAVHLFFTNDEVTAPRIVNAVHPTLATLQWTRDLSQVATRVLGNFGGSTALDQVAPGASLVPVGTSAWYQAGGGIVLVGQQRVRYSGLEVGGGGSLVGPGAAPTGAPNVELLPGAGVDVGAHDYAVTFKTAAGESIPGPRIAVPVGVFLPPTTAPTAGTPGPGTGPAPGMHDYAVAFVVSSGETVPGPRVAVSNTDLTPAPTTGPTPSAGALGVGPDPGVHDYAVVFQTANGFTTPGPIGGQIAVANTPLPAPTAGPAAQPPTSGGNVDIGDHWYTTTFLTASGETTGSPAVKQTALPQMPVADPTASPGTGLGSGMNNVTGGWLYYSYAYRTASGGETLQSPTVEVMATLAGISYPNFFINIAVTAYASPDPAVSSIVFYRAFARGAQKRQWATTSNVTSTQNDPCSNVNGPLAPTGPNNTVGAGPKQTIPLTTIQTGPAGTIARRIYRSAAGGGVQRLLATLNNNSSTTYTDTLPDSALGAAQPIANTALVLMAVHLTSIPRGPGGSNAAVLARLLYRRSGGADLRYLAVIGDNSTTTYDDTTPNAGLGAAPPAVNTATLQSIPLTKLPLGNSLVVGRVVYRTAGANGGGTLFRLATLADNVTTEYLDTFDDASLGAPALAVGTAQAAQVHLTAIPLGAASVIARVLYRTKAGAAQLQTVAALNDNVTTQYLDTKIDAALGANAPPSDTSLLQQPVGNVLVGAPSLPCATVAAFRAAGGWAIVGSQNIRYTGISGNALLGIPPSGPGAITATITWNTTVVAAALLTGIPTTGVGAIKYAILKGDQANVFVQVDDLDAQAAVRAQLPGSDGVIEDEIQDGRLSYVEGVARCQARLALLGALDSDGKVGVITVSFVCRDINAQAGAIATVNLGPPVNIRGDFRVQRVHVSRFNVPHLQPTFTVEASSLRFSAEEMLRLVRQGGF